MTARKFFTAAGVVAVAGVAGAISYRHQEHLAATHGQGSLAVIWPACIDGLVTVTAIAISTDRADGYRPRLWALFGFWFGVAVSVVTNWMATDGGVINHGASALPAVAFLCAIETLSSKPRAAKPFKKRESADFETTPAPQNLERSSEVGSEKRTDPILATTPKPRAPRSDSNATRVAKAAARKPAAKPAELAAQLQLSDATVRRHLKSDKADAMPSTGAVVNGYDHTEVKV